MRPLLYAAAILSIVWVGASAGAGSPFWAVFFLLVFAACVGLLRWDSRHADAGGRKGRGHDA